MRRLLPRRSPTRSIAAISLAIAAAAAPAYAQSAEAQALFNDGAKLMKQGKIKEACDAFEASNRIEARAGTLIRLGECREANKELASAWSAYKDALTRVKDPKKEKVAQQRIAVIEPRLSYLTFAVLHRVDGLTITRDGKSLDPGLWNRAIPTNGGEFTITATAPDHKEWSQTVRVPDESGRITVDIPKLKDLPASEKPDDKRTIAVTKREEPPPPPPSGGTFTTKRGIAVGTLVVGAGAIVAGALLWNSAKSSRDDAFALCPDPNVICANADRANDLIATAHTRGIQTDVALAVGGVAVVVAATLWFTGAPERRTNVAVDVSRQGGTFVLMGRF